MTRFGKLLISKKIGPLFFWVLLAANLFVYWEIHSVLLSGLSPAHDWWLLAIMIGVLILYFALEKQRRFTRFENWFMRFFGWYIGSFLYLFLCLAAVKPLQLFLNLLYPHALWRRACFFLGAAAACLIILYGAWNAGKIKTVPYSVPMGTQGKTYRLVLLSDLHLGNFIHSGHIRKVVDTVNACAPDMVVIAGDIFNGRSVKECADWEEAARLFSEINCPDGVWAAPGNHDPLPEEREFQKFIRRADISLLADQCVEFPDFVLAGRKDMVRQSPPERLPLAKLLGERSARKPCIVIDHNPRGIDEAAAMGVELVLCGHTHKGQFFPMDLFARAAYGKERFWGKAQIESTCLVVSAGAGYFQIPLRIHSHNEVVNITLTF